MVKVEIKANKVSIVMTVTRLSIQPLRKFVMVWIMIVMVTPMRDGPNGGIRMLMAMAMAMAMVLFIRTHANLRWAT